jgi:hypothetical protein
MYINFTLIIQIINFLITYWFLNKLLFTPFITSIQKKNEKEKQLLDRVDKEEKNVTLLKENKKLSLLTFQKHVKKSYPPPSLPTIKEIAEIKAAYDKKKLVALTKQAEELLIKKAPHAF